jgi:branched-chain amino acid transport system permease protein
MLTILIDGLTYASWLFIVALGLTLVFGVLKILNIAHGSFYALGAYAAASFVGWASAMKWAPGFTLVAMLLAAVAVAALVAPLVERGLLRFFYGRDEVLLVLVTYAMFLILEDATKLLWGANPYYVSEPYGLFGNIDIGTQTYVGYDFALVGLAVVVGLAVSLVQALTQIQETTLTFVPKLVTMLIVMMLALPFMLQSLQDYGNELFERIATIE